MQHVKHVLPLCTQCAYLYRHYYIACTITYHTMVRQPTYRDTMVYHYMVCSPPDPVLGVSTPGGIETHFNTWLGQSSPTP